MVLNTYGIGFILLGFFSVTTAIQSPVASTDLKFSVNSRRNVTGHWIAQVQLKHGGSPHEIGPWDVDIEHITTKYDNSESILLIATITVPPQRPGADYEFIPRLGYYKFHQGAKNWHDARDMCIAEGTHLIIINSDMEFNAIRNKSKYIWTGVNDLKLTGHFLTIFYETLNATGYSKWQLHEPNHTGHCVVIEETGHLHDTPCSEVLPFVCEQEF